MKNHLNDRVVRRAWRALALVPAFLLLTAAGPALATAPSTWETSPSVSAWHALLVYLIIPAGAAIVITLLVVLPSMIRGEKRQPGQAWREEPEWFGGPQDGAAAADQTGEQADASGGRGGAGARW